MNTPLARLRELRDDVGPGDPAADLVSALPKTEPVGSNSKARVWTKIHAPRRARIPLSLRLAAAAILLMASAAVAGNRMHWFGAFSSIVSGAGSESGAGAAAPTVAIPKKLPLPPVSRLDPREGAEAIPSADPTPEPVRVPATPVRVSAPVAPMAGVSVAARPIEPAPPAAAPVSAEPARSLDEAELVLDGLRALRKEGNPTRARTLFSQYLAKHPNGALAEDAMGYQMEAADRAGSPDAATLGRVYLSSHPSGRYVGLARRLRDKSVDR